MVHFDTASLKINCKSNRPLMAHTSTYKSCCCRRYRESTSGIGKKYSMSACVCGCICVLCMYEFDMNLESFEWIKLKFNRFTSHWLRRTSPWLSVQIACFRSVIFKQKLSLAVYVRANCIATTWKHSKNQKWIPLSRFSNGIWWGMKRRHVCVCLRTVGADREKERERELNLTILVFV